MQEQASMKEKYERVQKEKVEGYDKVLEAYQKALQDMTRLEEHCKEIIQIHLKVYLQAVGRLENGVGKERMLSAEEKEFKKKLKLKHAYAENEVKKLRPALSLTTARYTSPAVHGGLPLALRLTR